MRNKATNADQTLNRLKRQLSNEGGKASASSLWHNYRKANPADPVSEEKFTKLVEELRLKDNSSEPVLDAPTKAMDNLAGPVQASSPVDGAQRQAEHISNGEEDNKTMIEELPQPRPESVFDEFVRVWRDCNPQGAQKKTVDVLAWSFGD